MSRILSTEKLNSHYAAWELEAPDIASRATVGQIVLASFGDMAMLPLPVTSVDAAKGTLNVLGAAPHNGSDPTTLPVELRGPFGNVTSDNANRVLCVTQGLGAGAMISRLEAYKARDAYTIVVAGYSTAGHIFWRELLDGLSDELYIVTEDGSYGIKGPIRDTVKAICQNVVEIDRIVAVGSLGLLKSCAKIADSVELPLQISLAAVADPNTEDAVPESDALAQFDWSRTEMDGHKANFDELKKQLGLYPAK